jgi:hypothetical protein
VQNKKPLGFKKEKNKNKLTRVNLLNSVSYLKPTIYEIFETIEKGVKLKKKIYNLLKIKNNNIKIKDQI